MFHRKIQALCWTATGLGLLLIGAHAVDGADAQPPVTIVVGADASSAERIAAEELASYLRRMYPGQTFALAGEVPPAGRCIVLGTLKTNAWLARHVSAKRLAIPESFLVAHMPQDGREVAIIAGADPLGCAFGVYALLEKLGCGFYLSFDALPKTASQPFSFDKWQLSDAPLAVDRIVFNWHNFLSGCTGWNLADWQRWIAQSQKMRFNTVMVHAYGNNPMFTFSFGGKTKPVGYISSTVRGRDWGNEHVNDVRRLVGGALFDAPVWGADVALAPADRRVEAAETLMKQVFAEAARRGMHVCFALDVDTESVSPQEIIKTLPEDARFRNGDFWLAMPDTPAGYEFYRTQAETLLTLYPQIDRLVLWNRSHNPSTPWTSLTAKRLPTRWREEFSAQVAKNPALGKLPLGPAWFAMSKVIVAFQRALKDLHREDVQLLTGSWKFGWMLSADPFCPPGVALMPLDYDVLDGNSMLDTPERRAALRELAAHRPIVPVVWAHHDDGAYRGRSFAPFADFRAKLADSGAKSFGLIHWTTRPLDLYFKSTAQQVWSATENQPLRTTCDEMAQHVFGAKARGAGGEYLYAWITGAPAFSRETSDFFINQPFEAGKVKQVVADCRQRLAMLDRVRVDPLDRGAVDWLAFWRGQEEFIAAFFPAEGLYQQACGALKTGDFETFRPAVAACRPEDVVQQYARASSQGGISRGERASVVSMNLRWLTHFISLRQALGLEAVRVKLGPTLPEPLAQFPGSLTFFVDAAGHFWRILGVKDLGGEAFVLPAGAKLEGPAELEELCRSGIESDKPISIKLRPIVHDMGRNSPQMLRPGRYRVRLLTADPSSTAEAERVFDVELTVSRKGQAQPAAGQTRRVDVFHEAGAANRIVEVAFPANVARGDALTLILRPVKGKAIACGVLVEPEASGQ